MAHKATIFVQYQSILQHVYELYLLVLLMMVQVGGGGGGDGGGDHLLL